MKSTIFNICFFLFLFLHQTQSYGQNQPLVIIKDGKMLNVVKEGASWREKNGAVLGRGKSSTLYANKYIDGGDFTMKIKMSLEDIDKTTAHFWFFNNQFGFDSSYDDNGDYNRLFMYSPVIDEYRYFGQAENYFQADQPFDFEIRHLDQETYFLINDKIAATIPDSLFKQPFVGSIALRPLRNSIKIYDWTFEGNYSDFSDNDYVFKRGEAGYNCFRIPVIVACKNGHLLAFAEGRQNSCQDNGDVDIVMKRSKDSGKSWSELSVVWADSTNTCTYPTPIVISSTGKIILTSAWNLGEDHFKQILDGSAKDSRRIFQQESEDNGETWSEPKEITPSVKEENWTYYGLGYTSFTQLQNGPKAGRLVQAAYHGKDGTDTCYVHLNYSDDLGKSWQIGGICKKSGVNETEIVERADGSLLLIMRHDKIYQRQRRAAYSMDGGQSIERDHIIKGLDGFICQTSLLPIPQKDKDDYLLLSSPANNYVREKLLLRLSKDGGSSWEEVEVIYKGYSAYSDLIHLPNDKIGCLFEAGEIFPYDGIVFKLLTTSATF